MAREHLKAQARRVVIGLDDKGRSSIVSDGMTETRLVTEAFTANQIWQAISVPTPVLAENTLGDEPVIAPPPNGYTYVITTFPPDKEWDYEAGYAKALAGGGVADSDIDGTNPGMHQTDTVDIVTVISGEIWAVVETGETLLKPGDTLVQRGTKHGWRNRGDAPCVIAALHMSVVR
jgi:mannose-6-phosphate isomerase-like protein (cupin superfamily)